MAPPLCPLCGHELATLSPELQRTWLVEKGIKWEEGEGSLAYWRLCAKCHRRVWPLDKRVEGRYCRPFVEHWKIHCGFKVRLVAGDFYLTAPPPDMSGPSRDFASGTFEVLPPLPPAWWHTVDTKPVQHDAASHCRCPHCPSLQTKTGNARRRGRLDREGFSGERPAAGVAVEETRGEAGRERGLPKSRSGAGFGFGWLACWCWLWLGLQPQAGFGRLGLSRVAGSGRGVCCRRRFGGRPCCMQHAEHLAAGRDFNKLGSAWHSGCVKSDSTWRGNASPESSTRPTARPSSDSGAHS